MDGYTRDDLPEEYAALSDRREVMAEAVETLASVRHCTRKLGDALVAAGLPARDWLGSAARLRLLESVLPDVTLDDVITRLAEFSAGTGPDWLHGDREAIARFNDEVALLDGVGRGLRLVAQRERMASVRQRSDLPVRRALSDARVGTQLDLLSRDLRDLVALGPYLAPLSFAEWNTLSGDPQPTSIPTQAPAPAQPEPQPPIASAPVQQHTRLRDFAEPVASGGFAARAPVLSRRLGEAMGRVRVRTHALAQRVSPRKWAVLGAVAVVLVLATALLTLAGSPSKPPASPLAVSPSTLTLHCAAQSPTTSLILRNGGKSDLSWSVAAPVGIQLSASRGTLKPGTTATLTISAHGAKETKGTLTFTYASGATPVPYSVACP